MGKRPTSAYGSAASRDMTVTKARAMYRRLASSARRRAALDRSKESENGDRRHERYQLPNQHIAWEMNAKHDAREPHQNS